MSRYRTVKLKRNVKLGFGGKLLHLATSIKPVTGLDLAWYPVESGPSFESGLETHVMSKYGLGLWPNLGIMTKISRLGS